MDTTRRKRVSKNKKKSWRNTDINDVEEHLDDVRLQERTGGLVSEKPDTSLFFVETKVKAVPEESVPVTRSRKVPKPLRCHANLLPDPRIKPAAFARPGPSKKVSARVKALQEAGFVSKKQKMAEENRRMAKRSNIKRRKNRNPKKVASYDMWGEKDINSVGASEDVHYAEVTKLKRVQRKPRLFEKPSAIPAVEIVRPGASYNPAFDDHQELLNDALHVESKKLKAEKKLENQFRHFPTAAEAPTEATWLQEMSAGLFDEEVGGHDPSIPLSVNPPVRREDKKTVVQRRKDKDRKLEEKKKRLEKEKKLKDNEFFRLKSMKKEIVVEEKKSEERALRKRKLKEQEPFRTKKLGALKFEDVDMPVKLSEELQSSLRLLKPEGNLVEDRFKSLQKRNIIEPRLRAKVVKKYKPKTFEKNTHREVTL